MKSPADIIYQLLEDLDLIELSGEWPAFISFLPDFPHQAVAVYDTAGIPDGRLMSGTKIEHAGIQIQVRSEDYAVGWAKANTIATTLDIQAQVSVVVESDTTYVVHNISRTGTILPVGIDEKDGQRRHYFTINAAITAAPSP